MQYQYLYAQGDMSGIVESATSDQAGADTWVDVQPEPETEGGTVVEGWAEWGDWGDCECCCCTGACIEY